MVKREFSKRNVSLNIYILSVLMIFESFPSQLPEFNRSNTLETSSYHFNIEFAICKRKPPANCKTRVGQYTTTFGSMASD